MNGDLLLPPNFQVLSDSVIGVVIARRPKLPNYVFEELEEASRAPSKAIPATQGPTVVDLVCSESPSSNTDVDMAKPSSDQDTVCIHSELSTEEKLILLRRSRRRRTQQRYTEKTKDKTITLGHDVGQLREEVQRLEAKVGISPRGTPSPNLVAEYFRLFRHGLTLPESAMKRRGIPLHLCLGQNHVQKRFMQAAMAPDVLFKGGCGVEAMLENWRFRALNHGKVELKLERMEERPGGVIIAYINGYTTITERMLRDTFAHADTGTTNSLVLAWKLLRQLLVIPTSVRFQWDSATHQFVSSYYYADMLTPLMKLLGNLEDASCVMDSPLGI